MTRQVSLVFATLLLACSSRPFDATVDGGAPSFGDGGPSFADGAHGGCTDLRCQQVTCGNGDPTTTVSGTVFDPAGLRALYNVIVYVPDAPVAAFPSGVSCDQCGAPASGSPIVSALTGSDGKFVLSDVPVGTNIPLVLQVGKWRRQVTIPQVTACADTPMNDPTVMHLPRNQSEGDIPQIALTTGLADAFECMLRKVGIDDAEFTPSTGTGRVHIYQGSNLNAIQTPTIAGAAPATTLWSDLALMKNYDVIINACEGETFPAEKPMASLQNFVDYANAGGRSFNTHYQYYWIADGIPPMPSTANFVVEPVNVPSSAMGTVDTSFPKGEAFAEWLVNVGASTTKGQLSIDEPRYDAQNVNPPSVQWITGANLESVPALYHYTFNTPLSAPTAQQCGKVLFSDFHVDLVTIAGDTPIFFPAECPASSTMTSNELALEFMLFDLSSCIQDDTTPPTPPVN
jgi:hypothetical protein